MTVPDDPRNRPKRPDTGVMEELELRLRRLEDIAFEGDGLTRAVTRLGVNATALGEALITVDRNQQRLTRLGQQLEEIESNTATKAAVEATEKRGAVALKSYRKQQVGRIYAIAISVFALVCAVVLGTVQFSEAYKHQIYEVCVQRGQQADLVRSYLQAHKVPGQDNTTLLLAFKRVECRSLK